MNERCLINNIHGILKADSYSEFQNNRSGSAGIGFMGIGFNSALKFIE